MKTPDGGLLRLDEEYLDLGGVDLSEHRVSEVDYVAGGGERVDAPLPFGNAPRLSWIMRSLAAIRPGTRLLDAGAGAAPYKMFCRHLEYVSQDFGDYDGHGDGAGVQRADFHTDPDIRSDITAIPAPDGAFGAVLCISVLEHVPDPVAALGELARVLAPGGTLLLTAPFSGVTHYAPYHYAIGFNRYFYEHHLTRLGFRIEEITANGGFFGHLLSTLSQLPGFAQRYAGETLSGWDRAALDRLAGTLRRLAGADQGSAELLNYGWQVRARRG